MEQLVLGLGSNLGDRAANLNEAIRLLSEFFGPPAKQSSFIETEPWGYESANRFLNGVVVFLVEEVEGVEGVEKVEGVEILRNVQAVERRMGRIRREGTGYEDRVIDIDILYLGDRVVDLPNLKIPHPHAHERDFVQIPLREIGFQK